jgi:hypothetical protein
LLLGIATLFQELRVLRTELRLPLCLLRPPGCFECRCRLNVGLLAHLGQLPAISGSVHPHTCALNACLLIGERCLHSVGDVLLGCLLRLGEALAVKIGA